MLVFLLPYKPSDDKKKGKMDDKGKRKVDEKGKEKVDEKGNAKLLKSKKAKEAEEAELVEVVEVSNDEEDSSDEGFFGDEDLVLYNDVKYPPDDAEIRMFMERPTTSRNPTTSTSTRSRAHTTSTRSRAPIASTSNAQAAFTTLRGYRKIAMTGCVLALRAPNDPNALPPLTTRKRKS
nr:hypothetical protein [Tanacetum cinerariifolium]